MSELKRRNVPTAEFKAKVGLEAVRGVKTINELRRFPEGFIPSYRANQDVPLGQERVSF
jgi:hypothetical protein